MPIVITVLYNTVISWMEEPVTKKLEGVSERILACARKEFLEKGYADASLRTIAAAADTTTGSIYSRFQDKEGLFGVIVEPAADHLIEMFLEIQEDFHGIDAGKQSEQMQGYVQDGMMQMLDYIYEHFEDFELLMDAAYGTRYQDFVERLVEIETEYTYKYMETTGAKAKGGAMLTEEFVHIINRALFDSMFEVVRHKMPKEKAVTYIRQLEHYQYGGWSALMELN